MESIFKIKEEYKAAVVGFNNSGLPLGSRTDLHLLALMAHRVPDRAKYFERLPSEEEIRAWMASESGERRAPAAVETTADKPVAVETEQPASAEAMAGETKPKRKGKKVKDEQQEQEPEASEQ